MIENYEIEAGENELDYLKDSSIVSYHIEGNCLHITEECDRFWNVRLNKERAQNMIDQLQTMVNKLKD